MSPALPTVVVGRFRTFDDARSAMAELRQLGFQSDQMGLAAHDVPEPGKEDQADDLDSTGDNDEAPDGYVLRIEESALKGTMAGLGVGGLWAVAVATGLIPALGPVILGGALAAVLAGAATGAACGGLVGALVGMGVPTDEAQLYEREFRGGASILSLKTETRRDEAIAVLRAHGAVVRDVPAEAFQEPELGGDDPPDLAQGRARLPGNSDLYGME